MVRGSMRICCSSGGTQWRAMGDDSILPKESKNIGAGYNLSPDLGRLECQSSSREQGPRS